MTGDAEQGNRETTPRQADEPDDPGVLRGPLQRLTNNSYSGVRETFDRDGVTQ
jgi:hypothetical protein